MFFGNSKLFKNSKIRNFESERDGGDREMYEEHSHQISNKSVL